jgi:hypothetical protein
VSVITKGRANSLHLEERRVGKFFTCKVSWISVCSKPESTYFVLACPLHVRRQRCDPTNKTKCMQILIPPQITCLLNT